MKNSRQLKRRTLSIPKVTEPKRITLSYAETLDFLKAVTTTITDVQHQLEVLWVTNLVAII
jgi:hypothetical protein